MPLAKNHIPLTEAKLIRFAKKDMDILRRVAKSKRLTVAHLIRMAVFDYLKREGEVKEKPEKPRK